MGWEIVLQTRMKGSALTGLPVLRMLEKCDRKSLLVCDRTQEVGFDCFLKTDLKSPAVGSAGLLGTAAAALRNFF